jgi:hypothetical protein
MSQSRRTLDISTASSARGERRPLLVGVILVVLFYAAALPTMLLNLGPSSRGAQDQDIFHLPAIRQFIREWPHPDLSDYPSATTPGYHLFAAALAHWTSSSTTALRLIGSLFTAGLLFTLGFAVGRKMRWQEALIVCLPMVCSIYVFSAGAFLLPDNAGWWGVLAAMLIALRPKVDAWTYIAGGIVLLTTVFVRQIHLWAAAPLIMAALLGSAQEPRDAQPLAQRAERVGWMLLAIIPSLALLLWFRRLWHGNLVPPNQVTATTGGNPAAPAMILGLAAVAAVFFIGYLLIPWQRSAGESKPASRVGNSWLAIGAVIGLLIGILPRTDYDTTAGRFSGLWNAAKHLPTFMHRSPLIIALATLGGIATAAWLAALTRRQRWIWLTAAAAFAAAQTTAANAWQRYDEPFILIAAALSTGTIIESSDANPSTTRIARMAWVGPLLLAMIGALVALRGMR